MSFSLCKSTASLWPTKYILTINETFQKLLCNEVLSQGASELQARIKRAKIGLLYQVNLECQKFDC